MEIKKLCMGPVATNCYILKIERKVIVIDPSFVTQKEIEKFLKNIDEDDEIIAVLLTHGHYDHISGCNYILDKYKCPVYISFDEVDFLSTPRLNLSTQFGLDYIVQTKPIEVIEGPLSIGKFNFTVYKTPGHTSGSITYIIDNIAFDGDFIFKGSIGRTDLPTGSQKDMMDSLSNFLNNHSSEIKLYPGHGEVTSLGFEILTNPYIIQSK